MILCDGGCPEVDIGNSGKGTADQSDVGSKIYIVSATQIMVNAGSSSLTNSSFLSFLLFCAPDSGFAAGFSLFSFGVPPFLASDAERFLPMTANY